MQAQTVACMQVTMFYIHKHVCMSVSILSRNNACNKSFTHCCASHPHPPGAGSPPAVWAPSRDRITPGRGGGVPPPPNQKRQLPHPGGGALQG
jgi:hypothetical protein